MPRIGVTGHMNLTPDSVPLVEKALREALTPYADGDLVGISCIARGADSIFAQVVLYLGGQLEVVLPAAHYREQKVKPDHESQFDELMSRASDVRVLPFPAANREAYEAANEALIASCDRLIAVWDGRVGVDKGSTASVVAHARERQVPVDVVWPAGARRD